MEVPWGAIVALGTYILGSTVGFIWWMATITEKLNNLTERMSTFGSIGFARKEDVDREFGRVQKDVDAAHKRIDDIQNHRS